MFPFDYVIMLFRTDRQPALVKTFLMAIFLHDRLPNFWFAAVESWGQSKWIPMRFVLDSRLRSLSVYLCVYAPDGLLEQKVSVITVTS